MDNGRGAAGRFRRRARRHVPRGALHAFVPLRQTAVQLLKTAIGLSVPEFKAG